MSNIQLYQDMTTLSNIFLRRIRVPTEKSLGKLSSALLDIFIEHYKDKKDELLSLREKKMPEVNRFLTLKVTFGDLHFAAEKNLPRAKDYIESYILKITECPCIIWDDKKQKYKTLPLLKAADVDLEGYCKITFNDVLLEHLLPKSEYGAYEPEIIKELQKKNMYAGYIYQEACSWENLYNHGRNPFFIWTLSDIRKKFSFDEIIICEDGTKIKVTEPKKKMRIDNLLGKVLNPAIKNINDLYDQGKIRFWIDVSCSYTGEKKTGRSPKNCFRFEIHKEKKNNNIESFQSAVQQEIQFDECIILDNVYMIHNILKGKKVPQSKIDKITGQIKERETADNNYSEQVLSKIRTVDSKHGDKGDKEWWYIISAVLWREFHLGVPGKKELQSMTSGWPDTIDEKIKLMQNSWEICDKAIREYPHLNLTQEKVISILGNEFKEYCIKSNPPKTLRDWEDATSLFYTLLGKPYFNEKLNYGTENNQKTDTGQSDTASNRADDYFKRRGSQRIL